MTIKKLKGQRGHGEWWGLERKRHLWTAHDAGVSVTDLQRKFNCTRVKVYEVLRDRRYRREMGLEV